MQTCQEVGRHSLLVDNGDNSSRLSGEAVESGHGQVKVLPGRIAPTSTGSRWAEVRGRDNDRLGEGIAPASGICAGRVASKRVASSTYCSSVPQGSTQGSCVHSVAHGVGVSISTSSACNTHTQTNVDVKTHFKRQNLNRPLFHHLG